MNTAVASKAELIRTINDRCRRHFLGCQVMATPSVQELSYGFRAIDSTRGDSGGGIRMIDGRAMIRGRRTWLGSSTI